MLFDPKVEFIAMIVELIGSVAVVLVRSVDVKLVFGGVTAPLVILLAPVAAGTVGFGVAGMQLPNDLTKSVFR